MTKFADNNAKNASISHISFLFNYKYYLCIFYKKKPQFIFKIKYYEKLIF